MARKASEEILKSPEVEVSDAMFTSVDGSLNTMEDLDFGLEGSQMTLSQIPVLKLAQAMSPEATSRDYPDIYPGTLFDSNTKEALDDGNGVIIRIMRAWRQRTKFYPRDTGNNGIECSCPTFSTNGGDIGSEYGPCNRCEFNNFDMPDHCQTQYHIVATIGDDPYRLCRIILAKTSYKAGAKLDRALKTLGSRVRNKPVFCFKVRVSANEVKSKMGSTYYTYNLEVLQPKDGEELLPADVVEDFVAQFKEIGQLREEALTYHKEQLANKEAEEKQSVAANNTSSFDALGESIASTFETEGGFAGSENEEVPF